MIEIFILKLIIVLIIGNILFSFFFNEIILWLGFVEIFLIFIMLVFLFIIVFILVIVDLILLNFLLFENELGVMFNMFIIFVLVMLIIF